MARRLAIPLLSLLATVVALSTPAPTTIASCFALPDGLSENLAARGYVSATPIQEAALGRVHAGESLMLHAETGSGKTLAMLLPALCRSPPDSRVLILSPTRELAVQLGDEASALLEEMGGGGVVRLVAQGHPATAAEVMAARVVVATPTECCQLLSGAAEDAAAAGKLAEALGASVATLVLDEVDALIPGQKPFRGKRHSKWMDKDMHPAEAVVKMLSRRSSRDDLQVLAASATLDKSSRRKLVKLLRTCPRLEQRGSLGLLPILSTIKGDERVPAPVVEAADEEEDEEEGMAADGVAARAGEAAAEQMSTAARIAALVAATEAAEAAADAAAAKASGGLKVERWTAVPRGIEHYTWPIQRVAFEGSDGTAVATAAAKEVHLARAARGSTLLFVSSRSTYLGGAHQVTRALRSLGVEAEHLSDALWPASTRAKKRGQPRSRRPAASAGPNVRMGASDDGDAAGAGSAADAKATRRRGALNSALAQDGASRLLVADAAATRGLHLNGVATVIVLGLPANADTYLHLAGRTGRWPRDEGPGAAVAVTIATEPELRTLGGWAAGLGGVTFLPIAQLGGISLDGV